MREIHATVQKDHQMARELVESVRLKEESIEVITRTAPHEKASMRSAETC